MMPLDDYTRLQDDGCPNCADDAALLVIDFWRHDGVRQVVETHKFVRLRDLE